VKRPKLIVILLAGGILVLIAGSAIAASLPSWPSHKATMAAEAPVHRSALASAPASRSKPMISKAWAGKKASRASKAKKFPAKSRITYTVKAGDTLSGIATWFRLHGYGALYDANRAVIGSNPNLIFPGERITISNGVMKLSGTRS
jgi:nucleoid-associated protein YgaU